MNLNKIRQKAEQNAKSRVCWVLCAKMQVLADLQICYFCQTGCPGKSWIVSEYCLVVHHPKLACAPCICGSIDLYGNPILSEVGFSQAIHMQNETGAVFSKYDIQLQIPIHSMHTQIHYNLLLCSMVL